MRDAMKQMREAMVEQNQQLRTVLQPLNIGATNMPNFDALHQAMAEQSRQAQDAIAEQSSKMQEAMVDQSQQLREVLQHMGTASNEQRDTHFAVQQQLQQDIKILHAEQKTTQQMLQQMLQPGEQMKELQEQMADDGPWPKRAANRQDSQSTNGHWRFLQNV